MMRMMMMMIIIIIIIIMSQDLFGRCGEEKNLFALSGNEPIFFHHRTRTIIILLTTV